MKHEINDKYVLQLLTYDSKNRIVWKTLYKEIEKDIELKNYLENRYNDNLYIYTNLYYLVIYRIQHNIETWPLCPICKSPLPTLHHMYCSRKCAYKDPSRHEKTVKTCLKLYGVTNGGASKQAHEKIEKTLKEHYGQDVKSAFAIKEVRDKSKETLIQNYGVDHNWKIEGSYEKKQQTWLSTIGVINPYCQEKCKNKMKETYKNNSESIHEKIRETYKKNTGFDTPWDDPSYRDKVFNHRYCIDNINFISSYEVAFYIYHRDKNNKIIKEPCKFEYYYKDKKHYYYPDFEINGKLYELKGNQFLDKTTGKWKNPYRDPNWTEEEYQESCDLYEVKHQCALQNNVEIIYDCSKYLNYIKKTYGKTYLNSIKIKLKENK